VLLHGFPSSSREFDTLIPLLATHYHLIAPDFSGFGQSEARPPSAYRYTFDHLAETMDNLLVALKVSSYTLYIHDYGAPVGMRMILAHPERLHALISQNGNIYEAGLGAKWTKIAQYWADPKAHPEVVDAFLSFDATEQRHTLVTASSDAAARLHHRPHAPRCKPASRRRQQPRQHERIEQVALEPEVKRPGLLRMTGIAFGWTRAMAALASVVKKPNSSCSPCMGAICDPHTPRQRIHIHAKANSGQSSLNTNHVGELIREGRGKERQIAGAIVPCVKPVADGRLAFW
jgi:pimeloyl-ACP methyl ester carboxylesterase